jgi:hypothetical protein
MSPKIPAPFPEVFLSDLSTTKRVTRALDRGEIRKIGPRLYTTLVDRDAADVVRQHWSRIAGLYFPQAVIGFRTVLDGGPAKADGAIFLTAAGADDIDLPSHRLRVVAGAGPTEGDMPYPGNVYWASTARALLEAARPSRARRGTARGYRRDELEAWLERHLQLGGEDELNRLRDQMRDLTHATGTPATLNAAAEWALLDGLIGALLGTRTTHTFTAPTARARLAGRPYDQHRVDQIRALHATLSRRTFPEIPDPASAGRAADHLAFFDAYFSNDIEGTTFEVDEARAMIFEGKEVPGRPADAHDIHATYELVRDPTFMRAGSRRWTTADAFIARLKQANAAVMRGRPAKRPGKIKEQVNKAGNTTFVEPTLVLGTLHECYPYVHALADPFARALALMFMITEVHPFADGNGRCARAFMNAELVAAGCCRIVIPTVFREDYIGALRALTRQGEPAPLLKVLAYAQRFTSEIRYEDLHTAIALMTQCHAFEEDDNEQDRRLRLPSSLTESSS